MYNISLEKLELSKVTILGVDSFCNLRFIQTASEQRLAIAPSSGRSHPQPPLTPLEWVPVLQLKLSPMAVMLLPLVPSSLFQTWVKMVFRSSPFRSLLNLSNLNSVDQILELKEWEQLLSHLSVSVHSNILQMLKPKESLLTLKFQHASNPSYLECTLTPQLSPP